MNKKLIRLTEQDLHRIVKESVNKILNEARHAWELTDNGIDEFNMDDQGIGQHRGWPTRDTQQRYDAYDMDNIEHLSKQGEKAAMMGADRLHGGEEWQNRVNKNSFSHDNRGKANFYVNNYDIADDDKLHGLGDAIYPEADLDAFNKSERQKQAAADKRWMKAADSRPLYRKNSPNNDIPK